MSLLYGRVIFKVLKESIPVNLLIHLNVAELSQLGQSGLDSKSVRTERVRRLAR